MNPVPFIGRQPRPYRPPPGVYFPRHRPFILQNVVFAAPTNLRGVSQTETTVDLIWDDNSTNETGFEIERALEDGAFSNITTTAANVTTFEDTARVEGTRYRYRVRATDGVIQTGYTNILTVVTQSRPSDTGFARELTLPRFDVTDLEQSSPQPIIDSLNSMAQKIEDKFNTQVARDEPCDICVTNGAIVLDASRCNKFNVTVDQDINSISIVRQANGQDLEVSFSTDQAGRLVSGWPSTMAHLGCGTASDPLALVQGFTTMVDVEQTRDDFKICLRHRDLGGAGGGGSGGGGIPLVLECEATAGDEDFTSEGTCASIDCNDSSPRLNFRARGGAPPYSWTTTTPMAGSSPVVTVDVTAGTMTLTPPTNGNNFGTQEAFSRFGVKFVPSFCDAEFCHTAYNCAGVEQHDVICATAGSSHDRATCIDGVPAASIACCAGTGADCSDPTCGTIAAIILVTDDALIASCVRGATKCDKRSAGMIADPTGCNPCELTMDGAVITVTDSAGTSASFTVTIADSI